ncbi:MAG: LysR family transcriptional regulator [Bdellovibrionaceae bacterium]|nr:LysR family transcriptional regulator [Pseudobdellovibrionaceae bacterium]
MLLHQNWLYFLKSAELGSFSKAANILNVSQGAISQALQRLENELGIVLFERGRGKSQLQMTPAGEVIFRKLVNLEPQFENEILPKAKGINTPIKIACVASVANKHLLPLLNKNNNSLYHIYIIPRRSHIMSGLDKGHFDLTILSSPVTKQTKEVFCDELFYIVGQKNKYHYIESIHLYSELKEQINLYDRKPFEYKWSNALPSDRSGYFLDDHFTGRELILNGHVIAPYSLFYFSLDELEKLAVSPVVVDNPVVNEQWKIQAIYDENELSSEQIMEISNLLKYFKNSLTNEYTIIRNLLKQKWRNIVK